jgi:hypothetical protein
MNKDFKQIFNDSLIRLDSNMDFSTHVQFKIDERDIEEALRYQMTQELAKKLTELNKVEITKTPKKDYDKLTGQYYELPIIKMHAELFVCTRENLFDVFHSFNELPELTRKSFIKWLAPNEEKYINQIRQDNLNKIFPPSPNNI